MLVGNSSLLACIVFKTVLYYRFWSRRRWGWWWFQRRIWRWNLSAHGQEVPGQRSSRFFPPLSALSRPATSHPPIFQFRQATRNSYQTFQTIFLPVNKCFINIGVTQSFPKQGFPWDWKNQTQAWKLHEFHCTV